MGNSSGKPVVFTDEVNLNHFRLLRVVGKGAFGKVRIVERKDTGLTFALKYIRKDEIVRSESVRNIIRERRMLEQLNHPFLCNLRYSFQDVEYLYIVVDLMTGGDLRFHIQRKTFTEDAVRFWIAELACALRYIHKRGIVHRDVKPDNVLLDSDGHVHLADFNVASDFTPERRLTSKSGTLAYLAPEVYEGRGYLSEVDWWSLGVTFYECIYNKRPFEASNHDNLSKRILAAKPAYPLTNPPVSNPCLHAISSLLEKDKRKRIGAAGFGTFTDNPFFRSIDFDALERKEIEPVFRPSADKTNFDATYDLEELLLEEAPLEARARRQKPREQLKNDATQEEIRTEELHKMIEQLFEPFNYTTAAFDKSVSAPGTSTPTGPVDFGGAQGMAPGTYLAHQKRSDRDRDQENHENSPARGTPARGRSATQSPEGSPPFPSASAAKKAMKFPHSDPHALPIQTYDDRIEMFTTMDPADEPVPSRSDSIPPSRERQQGRAGTPPVPLTSDTNMPPPGAYHAVTTAPPQRQPQYAYGGYHTNQRSGKSTPTGRHTNLGAAVLLDENHKSSDRWGGGVDGASGISSGGGSSASLNAAPGNWGRGTPTDSMTDADERAGSKPTGMLGFLGRKKGRDRSPRGGFEDREAGTGGGGGGGREKEKSGRKGKEKERGVLGKEGARVIVSHG